MYSSEEYKNLFLKYGAYSSWAVWDHVNESNAVVVDKNYKILNSQFVFLGLNISKSLSKIPWSNFHGGKHDRKLKYALNDTELHGSYMTDIFKDLPEPNSTNIGKLLTNKIIEDNVKFFNQEMIDIKLNDKTQFIILGRPDSLVAKYFNKYFKSEYDNKIIYYYHYAYYGISDNVWVEGLWKLLGIYHDFDVILRKYK